MFITLVWTDNKSNISNIKFIVHISMFLFVSGKWGNLRDAFVRIEARHDERVGQ